MLNIVLFGPPGSGKGTQSEKVIEKFGLVHISTGDLLREEVAAETELGKKAKAIMDKGELVSDDIVIAMIRKKLEEHQDGPGFIFDGFPRTVAQARELRKALTDYDERVGVMISLEVPREELVKRLLNRGKETGRSDDNLEPSITGSMCTIARPFRSPTIMIRCTNMPPWTAWVLLMRFLSAL